MSSERRPGAPQRLPTPPPCWLAHRPADQQRGKGEPGSRFSLVLYQSRIDFWPLQNREDLRFPIRGRTVTTTVEREWQTPRIVLPGVLQFVFNRSGYRNFPPSLDGVRIAHSKYNHAFLVLKVRFVEISQT